MTDTALAIHTAAPLERSSMTRDQIDLLKRTIAKGTSDDEFALFVATANRMGLDPFSRQIHCVKRWDSREGREVMAIQVGIDGFRASAERTGEYDGQEGPFWCGADGQWRDVWTEDKPPIAAKVLAYRKGISRPFVGIARYKSYVQTKKDGSPNQMWQRGDDFMIAKCAEAVALRKGFPNQLAGVHAPEEMAVDDERPTEVSALPTLVKPAAPKPAPAPPMTAPVASPTAPPTTASASPPPPPPPVAALTQEQVDELAASMRQCTTRKALSGVASKMNGLPMTATQREFLLGVYKEVADLIIAAEKAEQAEAPAAAGAP